MSTATTRHYSLEEYFDREEKSPLRHEFLDGEIFTMTGGTSKHGTIILNIGGELRSLLRGQESTPFVDVMRVVCPGGLYTYPDAVVADGKPQIETHGGHETLTNPILIGEVLSRSTESYDRGKKFENYCSIPALKYILLVSQNEPRIELFTRQSDDEWPLTVYEGLDAQVAFPELEISLALAEVYERIDFPPA